MPAIQTELRMTIEGFPTPLLVKRSTLQVSSCEQFSLSVDGVPPLPVPKPAAGSAAPAPAVPGKAKPEKRFVRGTYRIELARAKFVVIYDAGQGSGLTVKVGSAKPVPLTQPLVFMDGAAASLGAKPTIVVENESASARTAVMLVGSDLPKDARVVEVLKKKVVAGAKATAKPEKKKSAKK